MDKYANLDDIKDERNLLETEEVVSEFEVMEDEEEEKESELPQKEYAYQKTIFEESEKQAVSENSIEFQSGDEEENKLEAKNKVVNSQEIKLPSALQLFEEVDKLNIDKQTVYSRQGTEINFA